MKTWIIFLRQQSTWEGDKCNEIKGTDSTIFPPFLTKDEGLWTFTPDVCMSLKSHFVRDSSFDGMPSRIYSADFGDLKVSKCEFVEIFNFLKFQNYKMAEWTWKALLLWWSTWQLSTEGNFRSFSLCQSTDFWWVLITIKNILIKLHFLYRKQTSFSWFR